MTVSAHKLERLYVSSPIRRYLHQPLVTSWFKKHLPEGASPKHILEVGSGTGAGLLALAKAFPDAHIQGIEVDAAMAKIARRRITEAGINAALHVGPFGADTYRPEAHAETYDLIVSYGCIHHIPDWKNALSHIHAALKPNGVFCAEEYYAPLLDNRVFKVFIGTHPEDRFTYTQFQSALKNTGLNPLHTQNHLGIAGLHLAQKA